MPNPVQPSIIQGVTAMDYPRTLLRVGVGLVWDSLSSARLTTRAAATPQSKVTICHATSSVKNPYVKDSVNENSIVTPSGTPTGHGEHTGPVYPGRRWGDIIPPFPYNNDHGGTSIYPGLNWTTDGQAIWNGGCLVDLTEPPELPTTTTTHPEVTTTTSSSTTTTTHPEGSTTTMHPGGSTTTTLPPTTTPTTAPPSERPPPITDPGGGVEILPPTEAVVVDPGVVVVDLGMLSVPQRVSLEAQVDTYASDHDHDHDHHATPSAAGGYRAERDGDGSCRAGPYPGRRIAHHRIASIVAPRNRMSPIS